MLSVDIRAIAPSTAPSASPRTARRPSRLLAQPHARLLGDDPGLRPGLPPLPRRSRLHPASPGAHPRREPGSAAADRLLRHQAAPHPHRRRSAAARRPLRHHRRGAPAWAHRLHHSRRHRATSPLKFSPSSRHAGIDSLGLSLDGSSAARHEAIRGVAGCFTGPSTPSATPRSSASPSRSTPSSRRRPPTICPQSTNSSSSTRSCAGASST